MEKEDIFHRDNKDSWNMSNSKPKEFNANKYIFLRLEGKYTILYVNGKRIIPCKRLHLNIPIKDIEKYEEIKSIDEVSDLYDRYLIDNEMYKEEYGKFAIYTMDFKYKTGQNHSVNRLENVCPLCKNSIKPYDNFCSACGNSLRSNSNLIMDKSDGETSKLKEKD